MRSIILLSTTLSTAFSLAIGASPARAMGGPVYVDETCVSVKEAPATPKLKAWLKAQCPQGENAPETSVCRDLGLFIRAVAANNQTIRRKCGTSEGRAP